MHLCLKPGMSMDMAGFSFEINESPQSAQDEVGLSVKEEDATEVGCCGLMVPQQVSSPKSSPFFSRIIFF